MWYNNIPHVEFSIWLYQVLGLFNSILNELFARELFRFFMVFALLLIIIGLLSYLIRQGSKGRL